MKKHTRGVLFLVLLHSIGCSHAQLPYQFMAPSSANAPADDVARLLAQEGRTPALIDAQAGIVQTSWENTGFMYGQVQGVTATIWRRYTVTLAQSPEGHRVVVRADVQRCAQGATSHDGAHVMGSCEGLGDSLVPAHQQELERLGDRLRQGMSGTAVSI